MKIRTVAFALTCISVALASEGGVPARKKVIAYGWDFGGVSIRNVLAHTNQFDNLPIDGAGFLVSGWLPNGKKISSRGIMHESGWSKEVFARQIPMWRAITSHPRMRESTLGTFRAPKTRLSWTDDATWSRIATNLSVAAWIAKEGGFKGLTVDPEEYHKVEQFKRLSGDPEWNELTSIVRRRGYELFSAMFREFPDAVVVFFWGFSMVHSPWSQSLYLRNPEEAMKGAGDLWPSFLNGILDAMPETAKFVDGDEYSYEYEASKNDYFEAAFRQRLRALPIVAPENRAKYSKCLRSASAIYLDMFVNPEGSKWYAGPVDGSRLEHFRQNAQQALCAADEYIWLWGERGSWVDWKMDDWVGAMTNWEIRLPGLTRTLNVLRDPLGTAEARKAELLKCGELTNLVENAECNAQNGVVPKPFGTWHASKNDTGKFVSDQNAGVEGTSCLVAEGVGQGCFSFGIPDVKPGEYYLIEVSCKGEGWAVAADWKKSNGKTPFREKNRLTSFRKEKDGWSRVYGVVCVPKDSVRMTVTLNARGLSAGERVCFDNIAVYRLW